MCANTAAPAYHQHMFKARYDQHAGQDYNDPWAKHTHVVNAHGITTRRTDEETFDRRTHEETFDPNERAPVTPPRSPPLSIHSSNASSDVELVDSRYCPHRTVQHVKNHLKYRWIGFGLSLRCLCLHGKTVVIVSD